MSFDMLVTECDGCKDEVKINWCHTLVGASVPPMTINCVVLIAATR